MNTENRTLDLLAIGDTVVDAFIKLKIAEIKQENPETQRQICMPFGDKVPFESMTELPAVGNSANAAVSAARLGLHSGLLSYVGADENGKKSIAHLHADGVDTTYVHAVEDKKTNYHYVLWFNDERTILINHEKYDYQVPVDLSAPRFIYLSSLGENTLPFHHQLSTYLDSHLDSKLVFQPGTFQIKFGTAELAELYKKTYIFFCNKEEAVRILNLDIKDDHTIRHLLLELRKLGPKLPVITDGPAGAYTFDVDMAQIDTLTVDETTPVVHMPIYPDPLPPLERTGAGDAFASTFTVAIAHGKSIRDALVWGSINSMSVCQDIGAQRGLLIEDKLIEWIQKAPADWKAEIL